jgi:hypothetical protein
LNAGEAASDRSNAEPKAALSFRIQLYAYHSEFTSIARGTFMDL